jgi:glycosyltransferase involved in cell wall biosynthesis
MACGTPVIVSNVSSLPEVVGDAAVLVPPTDAGAIAGAIRQVLTSPGMASALRQAGRRRAGLFSQERMIREYLTVYQQVAGRVPDKAGREGSHPA